MVLRDVEVNTKIKLRICPAFFIKVFYTSVMWSYWGNYQFHIWPFMSHINVVFKKVITVFKTRPLLFHVISVFYKLADPTSFFGGNNSNFDTFLRKKLNTVPCSWGCHENDFSQRAQGNQSRERRLDGI